MPPRRAGPMKPWSQQVSDETRLLLSLSLSPSPFSPPNPLLLSSYLRRTCSNLQRIIGATGTARPQRYLKLGGSSLLGESIPFTPSSPAATVPVRMRLSPRRRAPRCPPPMLSLPLPGDSTPSCKFSRRSQERLCYAHRPGFEHFLYLLGHVQV